MVTTERDRRNLYEALEETLGPNRADTLMQLLPREPADQLVTISYFQTEMAALRAELTGDLGEVRGEMAELRGEMAEVRGEMAALRAELKGEMADMKVELKGDILRVENDLTLRFSGFESRVTRLVAASMAGNAAAIVTALLT